MDQWYSVSYFDSVFEHSSSHEYRTEHFAEAIRYAQKLTAKTITLRIHRVNTEQLYTSSILEIWHDGENHLATVENTPSQELRTFKSHLRDYLLN